MSTEISIKRPAKTLRGAAPVAMQCGRRGDRIALAQLRVKRCWLLRRHHDASPATSSPPPPTPRRRVVTWTGPNALPARALPEIQARSAARVRDHQLALRRDAPG